MAPFQYRPFEDRFSGTISDLMARKGDIAARGAERLGDIQAQGARQQGALVGGTIASIGQSVAGAIQQANDPRRKAEQQANDLNAIRLRTAQREVRGGQAVASMMQGDTSPADANGPRQESYLDANGLFDVGKMTKALGSGGFGDLTPELLKGAENINESILKHQALEKQAATQHAILLGDLADGTIKLSKTGLPIDQSMDFVVQPAIATKRITPQEYEQFKAQVSQLPPEHQLAALTAIIDQAAKLGGDENLSKDAKKIDRYGRVTASNTVEDPGKGDYTINGQRFKADGTPIGATVPPQKERVPPALGSFEDYVGRKYGASPTPAQIEEARKTYQQADDRPRITVNAPGAEGGLTPDGLALAATAYRLTRQLPSRNASQNAAIMNEAAKQASALGQSPVTVIQKQAAQKSDGAALTKMTTMASAAEAFETKANAQAGLVVELSKKVGRTGLPLVNGILVSGKAALGDTDAHLFGNALLTFTSEYAKIMEGATGSAAGSSDAARKDATRLISTALKDGTIQKTIQQMQWEMRQTVMGYDTVIGHINDRLGGQTPNTGKGDPLGIR